MPNEQTTVTTYIKETTARLEGCASLDQLRWLEQTYQEHPQAFAAIRDKDGGKVRAIATAQDGNDRILLIDEMGMYYFTLAEGEKFIDIATDSLDSVNALASSSHSSPADRPYQSTIDLRFMSVQRCSFKDGKLPPDIERSVNAIVLSSEETALRSGSEL